MSSKETPPNHPVSSYSRPVLGVAARAALCVAGGALLAVNVQTFVHTGGLLPGGFVGLALLIRETASRFFGAEIPSEPAK